MDTTDIINLDGGTHTGPTEESIKVKEKLREDGWEIVE